MYQTHQPLTNIRHPNLCFEKIGGTFSSCFGEHCWFERSPLPALQEKPMVASSRLGINTEARHEKQRSDLGASYQYGLP